MGARISPWPTFLRRIVNPNTSFADQVGVVNRNFQIVNGLGRAAGDDFADVGQALERAEALALLQLARRNKLPPIHAPERMLGGGPNRVIPLRK